MIRFILPFIMIVLFSACSRHSPVKPPQPLPKKEQPLPLQDILGKPIYMQIFKKEKILELWVEKESQKEYFLYKRYNIKKTSGKLGPKQREGDRQNPEGFYVIDKKSLNPYSRFLLSMNIGYPNRLDRNLKRTGYAIMIHGGCQSIGCFAMGDDEIEEIYTIAYNALESGQPFFYVAIYPFKMEEKNLNIYHDSYWFPFWQNLKEGYDLFNKEHYPPKVIVKGKKYLFKKSSS